MTLASLGLSNCLYIDTDKPSEQGHSPAEFTSVHGRKKVLPSQGLRRLTLYGNWKTKMGARQRSQLSGLCLSMLGFQISSRTQAAPGAVCADALEPGVPGRVQSAQVLGFGGLLHQHVRAALHGRPGRGLPGSFRRWRHLRCSWARMLRVCESCVCSDPTGDPTERHTFILNHEHHANTGDRAARNRMVKLDSPGLQAEMPCIDQHSIP